MDAHIKRTGASMNTCKLGDRLYRTDLYLGAVRHYGVVVLTFPTLLVAHIEKDGTAQLRVKFDSLQEFSAGYPVTLEPIDVAASPTEVWTRVQQVQEARIRFGLLTWSRSWNCESFANFVGTGHAVSRQADNANVALTLTAVLVGTLWLADALGDQDGAEADDEAA